MKIQKKTKYAITFDDVDKRIKLDGVENYNYLPIKHIIADTKELAIEYAKSVLEEVKDMHLTNSKGEEISLIRNGFSHKYDDYETANRYGNYWFVLITPSWIDKYGCENYTTGVDIFIKKIEVTEIV